MIRSEYRRPRRERIYTSDIRGVFTESFFAYSLYERQLWPKLFCSENSTGLLSEFKGCLRECDSSVTRIWWLKRFFVYFARSFWTDWLSSLLYIILINLQFFARITASLLDFMIMIKNKEVIETKTFVTMTACTLNFIQVNSISNIAVFHWGPYNAFF
jgi:hypothetical protein